MPGKEEPMRTLIVDDEYISRRIMQEMVSHLGASESVASGDEAVIAHAMSLDEGAPFDLILLDIEMPGSDGYTALQRIRAEEAKRGLIGRKAAKIIMITVRNDPGSVMTAFRHQCEAYLIKPVTREPLITELRKLGLVQNAAT
jgi:two-component system chemotaxis response regulator CheY